MPQRRLLLTLLLLVLGPAMAVATEEVFVLDNGSVIRGHVIRQDGPEIRIKLSGFLGRDATVGLLSQRVVSRFASAAPEVFEEETPTPFRDWSATARPVSAETEGASAPDVAIVPPEEPAAREEAFFARLARITAMALPASSEGRIALGVVFLGLVATLVLLGGRLLEIDELGVWLALLLAALFVGPVTMDLALHGHLLRADRAPWVLPFQAILWLGVAVATLRCGFGRVFVLFAFVSFSVAVVAFTAGAILVTW